MSELNEQIISAVMNSGLNDYDQRSAIGMARTWVDKREPIKYNPEQIEYPKRDQLAKDLVALMEATPAENEEYVEALAAARREVNRPFQNVDTRSRGSLLKPGEKKKARAKDEATEGVA